MDFWELAAFLDQTLRAEQFAGMDDPAGVWQAPPAAAPVRRVGLALGVWPRIGEWLEREEIEALVMHRPWGLTEGAVPAALGMLAYHLAFDERLTLGFNPWLAAALALAEPEVLGRKAGRPVGMIGEVPRRPISEVLTTLGEEFGGLEVALPGPAVVGRMAVVGAMTGSLVTEAARRGAEIYLTGQIRRPALEAVREAGLAVVAVGHRRSEVWGLRRLGRLIGERWPAVGVVVAAEGAGPPTHPRVGRG